MLGNGPRTVDFYLEDMLLSDIPFISEYRQAFKDARGYYEPGEPTTGKQVISRIDSTLSDEDGVVQSLVCCDDGEGIGPKELRSLYNSGRSTKSSAGRGSVGHGHLTAFAPSDLRYVLYAGRQSDGRETFGGHALLATHIVEQEDNGKRRQLSSDGFIRRVGEDVPFDEETGGSVIPGSLVDAPEALKPSSADTSADPGAALGKAVVLWNLSVRAAGTAAVAVSATAADAGALLGRRWFSGLLRCVLLRQREGFHAGVSVSSRLQGTTPGLLRFWGVGAFLSCDRVLL